MRCFGLVYEQHELTVKFQQALEHLVEHVNSESDEPMKHKRFRETFPVVSRVQSSRVPSKKEHPR